MSSASIHVTMVLAAAGQTLRVVAVLPARDEEDTIEHVVATLTAQRLAAVIVVDNGSRDDTAARAAKLGALVVAEPERGYGAAMLAGLARAKHEQADVVVMLDADGADPPELVDQLVAALNDGVDLVLGDRDPALSEAGSLTLQQRLGNALATWLIRLTSGATYRDLPSFKVIRSSALERLQLSDRGYGFTIQLLLRAHAARLRVLSVPIGARARRGGRSKVSGTLRGSLGAGWKILSSIARHHQRRG